jgi:hypothetical protein
MVTYETDVPQGSPKVPVVRWNYGRTSVGGIQDWFRADQKEYIFGCGNRKPKETRDLDQVRERVPRP